MLLVADGMQITAIAATVGVSRRCVSTWVQQCVQERLQGLVDRLPGRRAQAVPRPPPLAEPDDVCARVTGAA
jgi:transposase